MIRINSRFTAKSPEAAARIEELASRLVDASRHEQGNIDYALMTDTANPLSMAFIETWTDEASLAAHSRTPHFIEIVPSLRALTSDGMALDRFEY